MAAMKAMVREGREANPISGEELEELAKEVISQPHEVIERMKWVLGQ